MGLVDGAPERKKVGAALALEERKMEGTSLGVILGASLSTKDKLGAVLSSMPIDGASDGSTDGRSDGGKLRLSRPT